MVNLLCACTSHQFDWFGRVFVCETLTMALFALNFDSFDQRKNVMVIYLAKAFITAIVNSANLLAENIFIQLGAA